MKRIISLLLFSLTLLISHQAKASGKEVKTQILNESSALKAAIKILKGDPYGSTDQEVLGHITESLLIIAGHSTCGIISRPVWQFHILVPASDAKKETADIDGYLQIDATTGRFICAGLPFLD